MPQASVEGEKMRATDPPSALRVLIVDDNRDAADTLALLLKLWGFQPLVAYDGPAALAVAAAQRPDVVLLDLSLPGMDGFEVARHLRQQPGSETTPLIAVSGYGQEGDLRHTRRAGFDRHLIKPFEPEELRRILSAYWEQAGP
jgi:CheY-like chemotaxis protein